MRVGRAPGQPAPEYRVPGQEGPSPQRQASHELDGQAGTAVPRHHLGVAMSPGHMQNQMGSAEQSKGSQTQVGQGKDLGGRRLTAGSEEAPPWLSVSSQSRRV